MQIQNLSSVNFKNLYISSGKTYTNKQAQAKTRIVNKFESNNSEGESYIRTIKKMGYDILLSPSNRDNKIRLSIIENMEDYRLPNGKYDTLDVTYLGDYSYEGFSPDKFIEKINKKEKKNELAGKIFHGILVIGTIVAAMFGAKAIVDSAYHKRNEKAVNKVKNITGEVLNNQNALKLFG